MKLEQSLQCIEADLTRLGVEIDEPALAAAGDAETEEDDGEVPDDVMDGIIDAIADGIAPDAGGHPKAQGESA